MKIWIIPVLLPLLLACSGNDEKELSGKDALPLYAPEISELMKQSASEPGNILLREKLIERLDSAELYQEALAQVNQLIGNDSLNHRLWFKKARYTEQLKDTNAAIRYYQYSVKIYPTLPALLSMANLLAEQRDPLALKVCSSIGTDFTGTDHLSDLHFIKGIYHARTENRLKAIASFDSCITGNYRYLEAYMEKGFLLFENEQVRGALTIFATVLKLDPLYTDGYYWLGKCYERLEKKDSAIHHFNKALALDPDLSEAKTAINRLN